MLVTTRLLSLAVAALGGVLASGAAAQGPRSLPERLDDAEFQRLVVELSEPDGEFADENYVSNELGFERVLPRLVASIEPGGVFVGVGPEQNFSYVAALEPRLAFVVDIRRQNLVEHLLYKALFELSADRVEFLARLFSRPPPVGVDADATAETLVQAFAVALASRELLARNREAVIDRLTRARGFALTQADRASLDELLEAFFVGGPEIAYVYRETDEWHPSFARLVSQVDESGRNWTFLGSEASFARVRRMQLANLIVPVVGDFAGPKALRAIGDYVRGHGAVVNVFYVSNVEPYLFEAGIAAPFYDNVATLPLAASSVFVRTFFGSTARACRSLQPPIRTPVVSPVLDLLDDHRDGGIVTVCYLVERSR